MDVFVSELGKLRDPDAHRRELLPHQKHLVYGIAGEVRTRITRYASIVYPSRFGIVWLCLSRCCRLGLRYTFNKDEAKLKLRDQTRVFAFVPSGDIRSTDLGPVSCFRMMTRLVWFMFCRR
jgi:hypothetical protein